MGSRRAVSGLLLLTLIVSGCSSSEGGSHRSSDAGSATRPAAPVTSVTSASSSTYPNPSKPAKSTSATPSRTKTHRSTAKSSPHSGSKEGHALPLQLGTGNAQQVITVSATSTSSTTGTLQAWRRVSGGWRTVGPAVPATLGAAGLSEHASESSTATPIGSFTLTQAFGHDSDPGTALPYLQTTPSDWWISQSGGLYNTHQRCASGCSFTKGSPNEHLYYETPYYNYAVVIDYNTRNAPGGVQQGRGSAFFLHVAVDPTTQGCVAIPSSDLVRILRWLEPGRHPRILIGVR